MSDRDQFQYSAVPFLREENALFLDFDGTLAPLQDDPDAVQLPLDGASILLRLDEILDGALVLISGRDLRDLSDRTPLGVWRAGGHGLEVCRPLESPPEVRGSIDAELRRDVETIVAAFDGVWVEDKGPVLAVHYRQSPSAEAGLIKRLDEVTRAIEGYKTQHGKMVVELKPVSANKGIALTELMRQPPFRDRKPIMVGDDTTDEDAIIAATALGGFGIKVGEGNTSATFRLTDTSVVWDWLRSIVDEHT